MTVKVLDKTGGNLCGPITVAAKYSFASYPDNVGPSTSNGFSLTLQKSTFPGQQETTNRREVSGGYVYLHSVVYHAVVTVPKGWTVFLCVFSGSGEHDTTRRWFTALSAPYANYTHVPTQSIDGIPPGKQIALDASIWTQWGAEGQHKLNDAELVLYARELTFKPIVSDGKILTSGNAIIIDA